MNTTYPDDFPQALCTLLDRAAITQVVQDWGLARDTGRWEQLQSLHAPYATVQTTWFVGSATEFDARSRLAAAGGARVPRQRGTGAAAWAGPGLARRRSGRQCCLMPGIFHPPSTTRRECHHD